MLSPDQVATQGPGGFLSLNGGPTDPYYALANGAGYASLADACSAVPRPARRNRTVNVLGQEYWWLESDLSDNGLVAKMPTGAPSGGSGSSYSTANFEFDASNDGENVFQFPIGTTGIDYPVQVQAPIATPTSGGQMYPIAPQHTRFDAVACTLTVLDGAKLLAGQTIVGVRKYGGDPQGGGDIDASRIVGVLSANQLPPLADADIAQLYELLKPYLDQRYVKI